MSSCLLPSQTHPIFAPNEMHFIHDEEVDVLDVLALLPASREDVPFLRGADDDVPFAQQLQVSAGLPRQQDHLLIETLLELFIPVQEDLTKMQGMLLLTSN